MYRRIEIIHDCGVKTGICGCFCPNSVVNAWFDKLRGLGTGKNNRYFFTEKGWDEVGRAVIVALKQERVRFRIISVKHRDVDVMAGDNLEVAVRFRSHSQSRRDKRASQTRTTRRSHVSAYA